MAYYISKVQLPGSATEYLVKDSEGRALIAPEFSAEGTYVVGDHVIYNGKLYRFHTAHASVAWNNAHVDEVTVDSEIQRLEALIGDSGLRYVGQTYSELYDGSTLASISIVGGGSHTAMSGDIAYFPLSDSNTGIAAYTTGTAYANHKVIRVNKGSSENPQYRYFRANKAITAGENTSLDAIEPYIDYIGTNGENLEFLFNGTMWSLIGGASEFGSLAYKDSAQGTVNDYATGVSGTISKAVGTVSKGKLSTTSIYGVKANTTTASKVTLGTAKDIAKAGTAVVYGKANVGAAVVYGTANVASNETTVGNADVGAAVVYGTANKAATATTVGNANVGTAVTYGTANKASTATSIINLKSGKGLDDAAFATEGITVTVSNEVLSFSTANTSDLSVSLQTSSVYGAVDSTTKLTPAVASNKTIYGAVDAPNNQTLTPAVASSTKIHEAVPAPDSQTLTPATAAPNSQTIIPAVSNGTLQPVTAADVAVPVINDSATTVATGAITTGTDIVTGVATTTETLNVSLTTGTKTITVK